jgi:pyruvate/2-oxoglutarate dehydrogenase complex dihydrolipoamide acyltransferase (E2) component
VSPAHPAGGRFSSDGGTTHADAPRGRVGGAIVARQMMNLSSSFDHRVVDGIDAVRFIQAVRGYLELPATMFVA